MGLDPWWLRPLGCERVCGDVVRLAQGRPVAVTAGTRWSEVLGATLPYGLTPPVLTDYRELSVAGTVVVAGSTRRRPGTAPSATT